VVRGPLASLWGAGFRVRDRMDEIAMSGDDRIDLKRCRIAVEKEIERVRDLDGAGVP
jgi:hypothetical protein